MSRAKLHRPGLEEFIKKNYKKYPVAYIASKFNITEEYARVIARRMGKTRKIKKSPKTCDGLPPGFSKEHIMHKTPFGLLLRKGCLTRHVSL